MIGDYAGAALIVVGFSWLLLRLHLVERSREINDLVRQSAATASDRALSDDTKAKALRRQSLALFKLFGSLTFGLILAVGLPILLVWILSLARLWDFESALRATLSWPFLIAGLVPFVIIFIRPERRRAG